MIHHDPIFALAKLVEVERDPHWVCYPYMKKGLGIYPFVRKPNKARMTVTQHTSRCMDPVEVSAGFS